MFVFFVLFFFMVMVAGDHMVITLLNLTQRFSAERDELILGTAVRAFLSVRLIC